MTIFNDAGDCGSVWCCGGWGRSGRGFSFGHDRDGGECRFSDFMVLELALISGRRFFTKLLGNDLPRGFVFCRLRAGHQ